LSLIRDLVLVVRRIAVFPLRCRAASDSTRAGNRWRKHLPSENSAVIHVAQLKHIEMPH
jgi:hypothetical protein